MTLLGFVTGMEDEAASLRPGEGRLDAASPLYLRRGKGWAVACGGIGKVNAAMAAQRLVDDGADLLVSLGVAGRIDGHHETGAHWIREAIQHDYGAERADGFAPFPPGALPFGDARIEPFRAIDDPGLGLPTARMISGDRFVAHGADALAKRFSAQLVDMETAAVAQVAARHGLGWAGIRAVSDAADDASPAGFERGFRRAREAAATAADQMILMSIKD